MTNIHKSITPDLTEIIVPKWWDMHCHLRQGPNIAAYVAAQKAMGCAGVLAMPNTQPPVARITGENTDSSWSIESYRKMIMDTMQGEEIGLITPIYLTKDLTPAMVEDGAKSGLLQAAKAYPPHGTTNSAFGVPLNDMLGSDVLKAMEANNIVLCIHGEMHGMRPEDYISRTTSAEEAFYTQVMPRLAEAHPNLKIVCEHITTKVAVDFVKSTGANVGATITPQHLLYVLGDLIMGLKYHLYCMPLVKFDDDRTALLQAATSGSAKFFAGTDSAPHTTKATACGCAAGCFTGGYAPQHYIQAFDDFGVDLTSDDGVAVFRKFLCENGPDFYGIDRATGTMRLSKKPQNVSMLDTPDGQQVTPLAIGMNPNHDKAGTTIPWSQELLD